MLSLRQLALKKFLKDDEIIETIGHSYARYFLITIIFLLIWIVLLASYTIFFEKLNFLAIKFFYLIAWIVVYWFFLLKFLNLYLDCFVITKKAFLFFRWDWVLKNSTQTLEREKLIWVDTNQNWLYQALLRTWDLKIKFEEWEWFFEDIFEPSQARLDILKYKDEFTKKEEVFEENTSEPDKFELLIDALWEILIEHKQKENFE